ncbi:FAD-dependent oxidoreductase [Planomonospora venezuelensis]|uniref:2-polyprenyl-6-methoxyphenol hydroxylase-like FAD-dependent oxidoreductase n=1 Tax=Planomonospora venezuelensis TaxID=1999 RepID=A0A841CYI2_PLAVE|nr:FAD-dependent oxidoreductase [Planomonospora venezuelensis]MBB5962359.1 2-polyprenyl-6-methoxyphenol hydroxylase-like FAD-dependent oxidoreductase [Planomonospora venezuelensis]GIN00740.1 FAD-dependent oxidoreductase [Planomonospora venezuelensis]
MRAIVVGGGVAGAASAVALRRAGIEVTVVEAYEDPAGEVGSFLSLAGNGLRALDALGCMEAVAGRGFAVPRQRMWGSSGRLLGDVPRGRLSGDPLHSVTLMRGHLVEELRAAAVRAGAEIVTGRRFEPGTAGADLVVGADGIWSATRKALDPAAPEPRYAGIYTVSGVSERVPGGVAAEPGVFNMVFARSGAFIHVTAPDGAVWWSAQVADPAEPVDTGLERLCELYRFEAAPSAILRAATRLHRPALHHVLAEVPVWQDGRTVLVGDAAHPVGSGQGAAMAVEDAVVLARAVREEGSAAAGLARYDRERRARLARLVRMASANRDAKTAGPVGRRINDLVMPVFFRHFYEKATGWLYSDDLSGALAPR